MRHSYLPLFAFLSLALATAIGCGGPEAAARNRLIGKWELATEQMREAMKAEMTKNTPGGADEGMGAAMMSGMLDTMVESIKMQMDFRKDGKVLIEASAMGQDRTDEGTWEIVSVDGNTVTLKITTSKGEGKPGTLTFIDDDTFQITPPEGQNAGPTGNQPFTMKRVK